MVFWSAAPSTTDELCCVAEDDRYVPRADLSTCSKLRLALLDHFVSSGEQRRRYGQAERLRRLEVDHQLELRRLLDGEVGGLGPLQDLVHEVGKTPPEVDGARPVRHQSPRIREVTMGIHDRQAAAGSQGGDP